MIQLDPVVGNLLFFLILHSQWAQNFHFDNAVDNLILVILPMDLHRQVSSLSAIIMVSFLS